MKTGHMKIASSELSKRDITVLKWQLKTTKIYAERVVEKCEFGFPRIVLLNPALTSDNDKDSVQYTAIANPIWLTCPYLNEEIHELENMGYISKISEFINNDIVLHRKMSSAHAHYYYLRKKNYEKSMNQKYPIEQYETFNKGVGGIKNTSSLKCLHLQFAHYRIFEDNVAGQVTCRLLHNKVDCDEARCRNALERT